MQPLKNFLQESNNIRVSNVKELVNFGASLGWTRIKVKDDLPPKLDSLADSNRCFRSGQAYFLGDLIFCKGNPSTSTEWIFVTDDGRYYETSGNFSVWHSRSHDVDSGKLYLGVNSRNKRELVQYIAQYIMY